MSAPTTYSTEPHDTPRSAYALLSRRITAAVVVWLVGLSIIAWLLTVRHARSMADMVSGLGQVGVRATNDMSGPIFLGMWVGMMVAMMLPTVMPLVLTHRLVTQRRGEGSGPTVAMVAGYLTVWSAIGVVPLLAFLGFRHLSAEAASSRWLPTLAGVVIAGAGLYQFTQWKATCLRACQTPLSFVLRHDFGGGARSAFRAGLAHGGYCLGCCWALMSVLVVVGFMNLPWMIGLALVFLAEKHVSQARTLVWVVGTALVALGLLIVVRPEILPVLSGGGSPTMVGM
jgi:predicted metal-binding membrane protein